MPRETGRQRGMKRIPGPDEPLTATVLGASTAVLFNVAKPKWSEPRPRSKVQGGIAYIIKYRKTIGIKESSPKTITCRSSFQPRLRIW